MSSGTFTLAKLTFFVFFLGEKLASPTRAVSQQIGLFMDKPQ